MMSAFKTLTALALVTAFPARIKPPGDALPPLPPLPPLPAEAPPFEFPELPPEFWLEAFEP